MKTEKGPDFARTLREIVYPSTCAVQQGATLQIILLSGNNNLHED